MNKKAVIWMSLFSMLIFAISSNLLGPSIELIVSDFKIGLSTVSLLITFSYIGYIFSVILSGYFSDILGRKKVLVMGLVILAAGLIGTIFFRDFYFLLIPILLVGAGGGSVECSVSSIIADLNKDNLSRYLNLSQVFYCIGAFAAPFIVYTMYKYNLTWRASYFFVGIILTPLIILLSYQRYDKDNLNFTGNFYVVKQILKNPKNILLCLTMVLYVGNESIIVNWISSYIIRTYAGGILLSSISLSLFWVTMTIGRSVSSIIGNRIKSSKKVMVCSIISSILIFCLNFSYNVYISIIIISLSSFIFSGNFSDILVCMENENKSMLGTAFGIIICCAGVGGMIFPALLGMLSELFNLKVVFNVIPAILLLLTSSLMFIYFKQSWNITRFYRF